MSKSRANEKSATNEIPDNTFPDRGQYKTETWQLAQVLEENGPESINI